MIVQVVKKLEKKNTSQKQHQFREERTLDQNLVRSVRWPTSCCWLAVGDDYGISCPHTNNKESQRRVGWVGWKPQEPWHRWHPTHRTQHMRTASNCLRRAYAICTKQVEAGSVAGAVKNWVMKGWGERSWGQCEVCMSEIPVIWKNLNSPRKSKKPWVRFTSFYILFHGFHRFQPSAQGAWPEQWSPCNFAPWVPKPDVMLKPWKRPWSPRCKGKGVAKCGQGQGWRSCFCWAKNIGTEWIGLENLISFIGTENLRIEWECAIWSISCPFFLVGSILLLFNDASCYLKIVPKYVESNHFNVSRPWFVWMWPQLRSTSRSMSL